MKVYVVGFAPAKEAATVGGFDWYPADEASFFRAVEHLKRHLAEPDDSHSLTFVPLDVPDEVAEGETPGSVDRDAVTAWIDSNLHLVEVGFEPTRAEEVLLVSPPRCIVYGCGQPADGEGTIEFALPGGGTMAALVCLGHRESLAANTLRDVSLTRPPDSGQVRVVRDGETRWEDPPAQTRPSAVVRRPDPETPISESTVAELLTEALERARARRGDRRGAASGRELSIFVTLVEDAITRHNKAVYMERGIFAITDAERIPDGTD